MITSAIGISDYRVNEPITVIPNVSMEDDLNYFIFYFKHCGECKEIKGVQVFTKGVAYLVTDLSVDYYLVEHAKHDSLYSIIIPKHVCTSGSKR